MSFTYKKQNRKVKKCFTCNRKGVKSIKLGPEGRKDKGEKIFQYCGKPACLKVNINISI